MPTHDTDEPSFYDAPPPPPGIDPGLAYVGQVVAHGTRAVLQSQLALRAAMLRDRHAPAPGAFGRAGAAFQRLPVAVQIPLVLLLGQLVGAAYERVTGHPPPQATQPTSITPAAASASEP